MYNTKLPPMSARPSLEYSGRLVYPASYFVPLPSFNGWIHKGGRVVLHRSTSGKAREVVVAVVIGGKAWRVDSGKPAQAKDLARRIEQAVADIPQDLWLDLDNRVDGHHPESPRWPEFVAAFDRHDARNIKEN